VYGLPSSHVRIERCARGESGARSITGVSTSYSRDQLGGRRGQSTGPRHDEPPPDPGTATSVARRGIVGQGRHPGRPRLGERGTGDDGLTSGAPRRGPCRSKDDPGWATGGGQDRRCSMQGSWSRDVTAAAPDETRVSLRSIRPCRRDYASLPRTRSADSAGASTAVTAAPERSSGGLGRAQGRLVESSPTGSRGRWWHSGAPADLAGVRIADLPVRRVRLRPAGSHGIISPRTEGRTAGRAAINPLHGGRAPTSPPACDEPLDRSDLRGHGHRGQQPVHDLTGFIVIQTTPMEAVAGVAPRACR